MPDHDLPETPPAAFVHSFHEAIRRILRDEPLDSFCDWFDREMGDTVDEFAPQPHADPDLGRRQRRHEARVLWHAVPVPSHRWRPRPMPKTERNAPCPCGSGKKYKQCCSQLTDASLPLPADQLFMLALRVADPDMLRPELARMVPPDALGHAAAMWLDDGMPERTVEVLEPLFEQLDKLDERHEYSFDVLMDALQAMGQEARRHALAQRVAGARNRQLATAARGRMVSMLADRGETSAAWTLFKEAQRQDPENPQFWHLELTLLLSEDRTEEARMRSTVLAAKARREGLMDLAAMLTDMGLHGLQGVQDWEGDDVLEDEEDEHWVSLCDHVPDAVDESACRALYEISADADDEPGLPPVLQIKPTRKLADLQRRWSRRFGADKPIQTSFQGDASVLLDELEAATEFLTKHPQAWLSIEVLDDLLLAAADIGDPDAPAPVLRGVRRLADHAVAVLRAVIGAGPVRLLWMQTDNRPALRILAQAIEVARLRDDRMQAEALMRWSLQLNPTDNHGWRTVLAPQLLMQQQPAESLSLMDGFQDDMPPMAHVRALALFMLDRREEAEATLRAAHAAYPLLVQSLLPDVLDAPPLDDLGPGVVMGGLEQAWDHRQLMRPTWVRSGALEWLRGLDLPAPTPTRPRRLPPKTSKRKATRHGKAPSALALSFQPADETTLRAAFPDYPRLHGLLTAMAWSPDLIMPTQWLTPAMALRGGEPADFEALQASLDAMMRLYNSLNEQLLSTPQPQAAPIDDVLTLAEDAPDALFAWAAGFVQGAELAKAAWRRIGHPLSHEQGAFASLYALAARAPGGPDDWRPLSDSAQTLLLEPPKDLSPADSLRLALDAIWRTVAPLRAAHAGM